jgi:hypothetical protein
MDFAMDHGGDHFELKLLEKAEIFDPIDEIINIRWYYSVTKRESNPRICRM